MSRHVFDSTYYEFAHGRVPRGRGSWAFVPAGVSDDDVDSFVWVPGSCTFTDAKRWVRANCPAGSYRVAS